MIDTADIETSETLKKYTDYKESGIEWIGEIPAHWEVKALGSLIELKSNKNRPNLQVLSVYRDYGVIPKDSRDDNHNATSLDTSTYKAVEPGYLVVNKMKAWQGSMGISAYEGIVSPAYITCKVTSTKVASSFLHQLLRCDSYIGEYNRISYGVRVGQWDMHFEDFKRVPVVVPPLAEQTRIAEFLDRKTSQIDQAIAQKERLIELLNERRQVMIHQAVTRGLNPDAPMKDSGIEWIGEIPAHWESIKIKRVTKKITDGEHISPAFTDKGVPFLSAKDVREDGIYFPDNKFVSVSDAKKFRQKCAPEMGDTLLVSRGATIGRVTKVNLNKEFCLLGSVILLKPNNKVYEDYLLFSLKNKLLQENFLNTSHHSAQQAIYLTNVAEVNIAVPPKEEQIAIVNFIKLKSQQITNVIKSQDAQIQKLQELKSTLINSAVTGKIKV